MQSAVLTSSREMDVPVVAAACAFDWGGSCGASVFQVSAGRAAGVGGRVIRGGGWRPGGDCRTCGVGEEHAGAIAGGSAGTELGARVARQVAVAIARSMAGARSVWRGVAGESALQHDDPRKHRVWPRAIFRSSRSCARRGWRRSMTKSCTCRWGMTRRWWERASGLSGSERQRLLIARAVVDRPALLILDEAMSQLDAGHRASGGVESRRALLHADCHRSSGVDGA